MKSRAAIGLLVFLLASGCGQLSREDLLSGNFGTVDKSPPKLVAPAHNSRLTPDSAGILKTTLVWESRAGALWYEVQIATDAAFTQMVAGSPFKIAAQGSQPPKTVMEWVAPDSYTYYWRVRANTTAGGQYSEVNAIHAMDAVYVYCPASETNCSNTGKWGNKSHPYQVIQDSFLLAKILGFDMKVAARGGDTGYAESVAPLVGDLNLKGGYNAANWSRDIDANPTIIRAASGNVIIAINLKGNFLLEGFTLISDATTSGTAIVYLENSSGLKLKKNTLLRGVPSLGSAKGVECHNSHFLMEQNKISLSRESHGAMALLLSQCSAIVRGNTILGKPGLDTISIDSLSRGLLSNNFITGGFGSSTWTVNIAMGLGIPISYNYFHSGANNNAANSSRSLTLNSGAAPKFFYNTVDVGYGNGDAYGIATNSWSPEIEANIFFKSRPGGTSRAVQEITNVAIQTLIKNLFVTQNSLSIYHDFGGTTYTHVCSDGKLGTSSCTTGDAVTGDTSNTTGNRMAASLNDVFISVPLVYFTFDGPDTGTDYNGTASRLELPTTADCSAFATGHHFEYFFGFFSRQVTANNCTASASFVDFSSSLNSVYHQGTPMHLFYWATATPDPALRYALKTSSPALNAGFTCSELQSATHVWRTGASSQADCDQKLPHHNAQYDSGNCQTTYLYPAIQIDPQGEGMGPFNIPVAGNGLCEAGETCLYNPNIGAYPGHGNLIPSGCDLSSVAGGAFASVNLLKYESNGY